MRSEWDKLTDPVEQEKERQKMHQRISGRAPIGRRLIAYIFGGLVFALGFFLTNYLF